MVDAFAIVMVIAAPPLFTATTLVLAFIDVLSALIMLFWL
jgi:hypothetical protein